MQPKAGLELIMLPRMTLGFDPSAFIWVLRLQTWTSVPSLGGAVDWTECFVYVR